MVKIFGWGEEILGKWYKNVYKYAQFLIKFLCWTHFDAPGAFKIHLRKIDIFFKN